MKRFLSVFLLASALAFQSFGDEQTRSVQERLKSEGFYYGEADGQPGAETSAAIKRYQIRNGLEVTGTLSAETVAALKLDRNSPPPTTTKRPPSSTSEPQVKPEVVESDRDFLRRDSGSPSSSTTTTTTTRRTYPPGVVPPPMPLNPDVPDVRFSSVFAGTPYETAPAVVQTDTLRQAQIKLARSGFYRGEIDALPGMETRRALLGFQVQSRLQVTGNLDLATLAELGLMPPRRVVRPPSAPATERRVYRGVWVH